MLASQSKSIRPVGSVRRAVGVDADEVARLALAFHAEDGHPLSQKGVAALLVMLEPDFADGLVLVLQIEGAICGYGVLSFGYGIEHGGRETFIEDIYTLPGWRDQGFGSMLFEALEDSARAAGCRAIHLEVMPGNRAEHWYRRLGYRDRGSQLLTRPL